MLQKILETYKTSTYDFRAHACTQDPLINFFEEWVNYYRLKWAIARVLMPTSILEIGVRYGYSARAFLEASPRARFLGIDADLPVFGGQPGAIDWAEKSLNKFNISILRENSQNLARLPGNTFDLIHIDGQQDGDGTFHDLELALRQGRYILVDGYHWSRENFLATNEWFWLNKAGIESAIIIPGYAGEFLIKTKVEDITELDRTMVDSQSLAQTYTSDYYLNDCGGYIEWRRTKGKVVDPRLQAVFDVGMSLGNPANVVDLGAGRGEVTHLFAQCGIEVTAIDYSADAVSLIEKTLSHEGSETRKKVRIVCDSVLNKNAYDGTYDLAIASDLVEHLSPSEDRVLYEFISDNLKKTNGFFIIHTAPNLWLYNYEHPRQQKAAKKSGFWLPQVRRTWYERLMHINEQNPRILRRELSRYFPHVLVWFADNQNMGGSLLRNFHINDMRRASSLFAVASHSPIDRNKIANVFCMRQLNAEEAATISLHITDAPERIWPNQIFTISIILSNPTSEKIASFMPYPFHLSYHWMDQIGNLVVYEGLRSCIYPPLPAYRQAAYEMCIQAPAKPGCYVLRVVPVQEMVRWYEGANYSMDPIFTVEET